MTSASTGAPPFGADADRLRQSAALLRQHLADAGFRSRVEDGERMDGNRVIQFALEAIGRAAARPLWFSRPDRDLDPEHRVT